MTESPKKILIICDELNGAEIKASLESKLSDVEVRVRGTQCESGEAKIVMAPGKYAISMVNPAWFATCTPQPKREFNDTNHYIKPTKLRGAAQHKRQSKKGKHK